MLLPKSKIHSSVGGPVAQHKSSSSSGGDIGDAGIDLLFALEIKDSDMTAEEEMQPMSSGYTGDVDNMSSGSSDMDQPFTPEIKHGDVAAAAEEMQLMSSASCDSSNIGDVDKMSSGRSDIDQPPGIKHGGIAEDGEEEEMQLPIPMQIPESKWRLDERNTALMVPNLTWEEKVLEVIHMIRRRDLIEFDHKHHIYRPLRFCLYNIALFDLDKESELKHGPLLCDIPESDYYLLSNSINVISIKVAESEVSGNIDIYGTVIARDQYDYRCVYLFKRGRDNPQSISSEDNTLTLTGQNQALAGFDRMYFEFHLKIKGEEAVDRDFSKGMISRNDCCDTLQPNTISLESYLSKVDILYMPVPRAVEASIGVKILNGGSNFIGKVIAQNTNDENEIILYDSEVAGTDTKLGNGGLVKLTRCVVSVPRFQRLMLRFTVSEGDHKSLRLLLPLGKGVDQFTSKLDPYKLQWKIIWNCVLKQRPNLFYNYENMKVLR